jgi:hypothetical protein
MAFSGLHVEFGYQKKGAVNPSPILGKLVSSEDPASGVATTGGAPGLGPDGDPAVNLSASADSWVSFGQPPGDPSNAATARRLVRANVPLPCFVSPGDQVKWVAT